MSIAWNFSYYNFSAALKRDQFIISSNLYIRLMHIDCCHNGMLCPIQYENTCQWNFRSPGIERCVAIIFLFQTSLFLRQLMLKNIRVDDKQQLRPVYPSIRHIQFPRYHCKIPPLFLLPFDFHRLTLPCLRENMLRKFFIFRVQTKKHFYLLFHKFISIQLRFLDVNDVLFQGLLHFSVYFG